jgi:hypothetical protein
MGVPFFFLGLDTQGVALGYHISPRWGWEGALHPVASRVDSSAAALSSPFSGLGRSVARRRARGRMDENWLRLKPSSGS